MTYVAAPSTAPTIAVRAPRRVPLWAAAMVGAATLLTGAGVGVAVMMPTITASENTNHSLTNRLHTMSGQLAAARSDASQQRSLADACKNAYRIATKAAQSIAGAAANVDGAISGSGDLTNALQLQNAVIQGEAAHMVDAQALGCG